MFKRKREPFHKAQIIAMILFLMVIIFVLSTVYMFSCFRACSECQRHTLTSHFKSIFFSGELSSKSDARPGLNFASHSSKLPSGK